MGPGAEYQGTGDLLGLGLWILSNGNKVSFNWKF